MSDYRCPACNKIVGSQVEPGRFMSNPILQKAGVAQLCKGCTANMPVEIQADLATRPEFFAENAEKKRRYERNNPDFMKQVTFGDKPFVVNRPSPSERPIHIPGAGEE